MNNEGRELSIERLQRHRLHGPTVPLVRRCGYIGLAFGQESTTAVCIWEALRVMPYVLIVP